MPEGAQEALKDDAVSEESTSDEEEADWWSQAFEWFSNRYVLTVAVLKGLPSFLKST